MLIVAFVLTLVSRYGETRQVQLRTSKGTVGRCGFAGPGMSRLA